MLIPHHKIEEVLARVDIVAIIGRNVQLKKSGRSFRACCPFHNEKTPSFYVHPERRFWNCFGCGTGGDVISFLQRLNGGHFNEIIRELAKEVSVDLGGAEDPAAQARSKMRQLNELVAHHFSENLFKPRVGDLARKHLEERGVSEESIRRFGLGLALDSWDDLSDRLGKEGVLALAQQAGLVAPRSKGGQGFYDTFRGRLMIPIRSSEGRTIAFGGRLLVGDEGPKYLNSKESVLYSKSEVLYGLDLAREPIRRSGQAVLVEGYFDVIGLHQAGIASAVALCSTTITPKQIELLERHGAKEFVLLLDGDVAGAKAVERLAAPILAAGVTAKVAVLPEGNDPDDFCRKQGAAAMVELLAKAPPLTEHLLARTLPEGKAATWESKVAALKSLRPVLDALGQGIERSMFLTRLAQHFGIPESDVRRALGGNSAPAAVSNPQNPANGTPTSPAHAQAQAGTARENGDRFESEKAAPHVPVSKSEELFCALLLASPDLFKAPGAEALEEIRHLGLRSLVEETARGEDLSELWGSIEPRLARRLQLLRGEILSRWPSEENRRRSLTDAAREIRLMRVEERLTQIKGEFASLNSVDLEHEETRTLLEEQTRLRDLRTRLTAPPEAESVGSATGRQG
jgi:DNA primase